MWTPTETDCRMIASGLSALARETARALDRERDPLKRKSLEEYLREVHATRRLAEDGAP